MQNKKNGIPLFEAIKRILELSRIQGDQAKQRKASFAITLFTIQNLSDPGYQHFENQLLIALGELRIVIT